MVENRKGCVLGTRRCDPQGFAQVAHCVTRHGRLTFGELCTAVGKRSDALSRMTDGLSEDLTVRLLIAVTELQRDTRMVQEVCRRSGGVFVPLDARGEASDCDVHEALLQAVQEIGEDSGLIARVLHDGAVTELEADAVDAEIDQTIQALLTVKARVRAKVRRPSLTTTARRLA